jgi:hypothetical protein
MDNFFKKDLRFFIILWALPDGRGSVMHGSKIGGKFFFD